MALCIVCEGDHAEPGYLACVSCLDEHGEDPSRLETVAVHLAMHRRDRSLKLTRDGLIRTLQNMKVA